MTYTPRFSPQKRPMNKAERELEDFFLLKGIEVNRAGYPDYWFLNKRGRLCFVEVKAKGDAISPRQHKILDALAKQGMTVLIFTPGVGFRPWHINGLHSIGNRRACPLCKQVREPRRRN